MSPVITLGALGAAAYFFLFRKKTSGIINQSDVPIAATSFVKDPQTGQQFGAQQDPEKFSDGSRRIHLFNSAGTRVVAFFINTDGSKQEIGSPPGTDASILAAARRAVGLSPK